MGLLCTLAGPISISMGSAQAIALPCPFTHGGSSEQTIAQKKLRRFMQARGKVSYTASASWQAELPKNGDSSAGWSRGSFPTRRMVAKNAKNANRRFAD